MEKYMKDIWGKLRTRVSREQSFLIILYLAFVAYLDHTEYEKTLETTEDLEDFRRLGNIFEEIAGYELKRAADDLEGSIAWKEISRDKKCAVLVREPGIAEVHTKPGRPGKNSDHFRGTSDGAGRPAVYAKERQPAADRTSAQPGDFFHGGAVCRTWGYRPYDVGPAVRG